VTTPDLAAADLRVVFLSRKFPPSIGGMQTVAADLWDVVSGRWSRSRLIAWRGSSRRSVPWMVTAVARLTVALLRGQVDVVVAGDGLMAIAARPALALRRVPALAVVHGLDLTWSVPGYRRLVRWGLRGFDRVLANSANTAELAAAATGRPGRIDVLRLGVRLPADPAGPAERVRARAELLRRWGLPEHGLLVLTLGRMVRRKGVAWFVEQVLPGLAGARYLVAGDGPQRAAVLAAATRAGVADRVVLAGSVTAAERELLLRGADLFVQPNISVPGDVEGFGLVVVEAALRGTVVLAADLEGLRDAVVDGRTGLLVRSGDPAAWLARLAEVADPVRRAELGERFRAAAATRYGHQQMGDRLAAILAGIPVRSHPVHSR